RYDVAHRQHDRRFCALAATLGALSGCLIPDGGPRDVPATSSATSLESEREASGRSDNNLDDNAFDPVEASTDPAHPEPGGTVPVHSTFEPGIPPGVDPGTPTYASTSTPIAVEPVGFEPDRSMLERIYRADLAAGGESFWFDRMLERLAGGSGGNTL